MRHRLGFTLGVQQHFTHRQPLAQLENAAFGQDVLLAGFAQKLMFRLVVTASSTLPIMPSTTAYKVTSASAISAGPAMVPPGGSDQG